MAQLCRMPVMIHRCYLEVTNVCNLNCVFCPKTSRKPQYITEEEFNFIVDRLAGKVRFLYLHLMGEPLLHPLLPVFVATARAKGLQPIVTTNGTLLDKNMPLAESGAYKVQISLHSHEGNGKDDPQSYIAGVAEFAKRAACAGSIVVMRLWNKGGLDAQNEMLLSLLEGHFVKPWTKRSDGMRLAENIYIEYGDKFDWPDSSIKENVSTDVFCHALRNQIGVLVDGSVVPCCLDHDGDMTIGNIFRQTLDEILSAPRARAIYDGFTEHKAVEDLCRRCGYANQKLFHQ